MGRIDLHLHTTYSDGTQSPEALVDTAAARGLTLIAITDHDEIGGVAEAQAAGDRVGMRVLSGVEINTEMGREDVHVLGYGFPVDAPALRVGLATLRAARLERAVKMVARLQALGYPLAMERLLAIAGHGSIGRPHLARALVEAGHAGSIAEAFDRLLGRRCPAYIARSTISPEEAILLIHRAGGIAGLAHPGKLGDPKRIVRTLREAGLDALEAYHSDHSPAVTARMLTLAGDHRLLVTGGTDSHGPLSPRVVAPGSVDVPDEVGERLLARVTKR